LAPDLVPLFDAILTLPPPVAAPEAPLQMLVTTLDYDDYVGRLAIGRLAAGRLRAGQELAVATPGSVPRPVRSGDVYVFENLKRTAVEEAGAGDIAAVAGLGEVTIGETITSAEEPRPLPPIAVEAPTVRMAFMVNTSPVAGRDGQYASSRVLRERLHREAERNVAMRVQDTDTPDVFVVSGRGELHLAILVETMRREGHEFAVGRPEVIVREEMGQRMEPFEDAYIDVAEEYVGAAVELLGARRGLMLEMGRGTTDNIVSVRFRAPTRGLIGLRNRLLTASKGTAVMHRLFHGYGQWAGDLPAREVGSIVAHVTGITTRNALKLAEERGELFVGPREDVYAGQVVGSTNRGTDLVFNVCRKKHLTNHRRSFAEEGIFLMPPVKMGVDEAIGYVGDDELVEVTPAGVRLRKRDLNHEGRQKAAKRKARESAG
ncbi:MAG: EF-Tu/IF-2/RF-3 family GTPase, partial [Anaerolineae bacterium]